MCHTKEDVPGLSAAATRSVDSSVALSHSTPLAGLDTRDSGRIYRVMRNNQTQQALEIKNSHIPLSNTTYHTTLKINQRVVYTTQIPGNLKHCCRHVELSLAGAAAAFSITFTMESVGSTPHLTTWARALFLTLMELSSRLQWEVHRRQSTVGLHWRQYLLGWNVRRLA